LEGFEELPGGWNMVVMEMIAEDYCRLMDFPTPYSHYDDIATKLASLPQASYVHGDVRNTNIMVKKDGSQGFKLVDFEWSGRRRGPIPNEHLSRRSSHETRGSGG
jgi:RIO-like serine/threonine protein kinase